MCTGPLSENAEAAAGRLRFPTRRWESLVPAAGGGGGGGVCVRTSLETKDGCNSPIQIYFYHDNYLCSMLERPTARPVFLFCRWRMVQPHPPNTVTTTQLFHGSGAQPPHAARHAFLFFWLGAGHT